MQSIHNVHDSQLDRLDKSAALMFQMLHFFSLYFESYDSFFFLTISLWSVENAHWIEFLALQLRSENRSLWNSRLAHVQLVAGKLWQQSLCCVFAVGDEALCAICKREGITHKTQVTSSPTIDRNVCCDLAPASAIKMPTSNQAELMVNLAAVPCTSCFLIDWLQPISAFFPRSLRIVNHECCSRQVRDSRLLSVLEILPPATTCVSRLCLKLTHPRHTHDLTHKREVDQARFSVLGVYIRPRSSTPTLEMLLTSWPTATDRILDDSSMVSMGSGWIFGWLFVPCCRHNQNRHSTET